MKLRLPIRDLLFATVIVVLAIGWGLDHWTHSDGNREMQLQIKIDTVAREMVTQDNELRRLAKENRELHLRLDNSGDQMPIVRSLTREEQ